jgi:hypothetical protein
MSQLARPGSSVIARTRWTVAVLAATAAALIGFAGSRGPKDGRAPEGTRPAPRRDASREVRREATNVSAEVAARTFVSSYVSFLYGRRDGAGVAPVGARLHQQLLGARPTPTPAEMTRALIVRDLMVSPEISGTATGSAVVDDGASPPYALSFNLSFRHRRWVVTGVQKGDR